MSLPSAYEAAQPSEKLCPPTTIIWSSPLLYSLVARWQWRIATICCMEKRERSSSGKCWQLSDHLVTVALRFSFWLVGQLEGSADQLQWRGGKPLDGSFPAAAFYFPLLYVMHNGQWSCQRRDGGRCWGDGERVELTAVTWSPSNFLSLPSPVYCPQD